MDQQLQPLSEILSHDHSSVVSHTYFNDLKIMHVSDTSDEDQDQESQQLRDSGDRTNSRFGGLRSLSYSDDKIQNQIPEFNPQQIETKQGIEKAAEFKFVPRNRKQLENIYENERKLNTLFHSEEVRIDEHKFLVLS